MRIFSADGVYVVACPDVGALSVLSPMGLGAFLAWFDGTSESEVRRRLAGYSSAFRGGCESSEDEWIASFLARLRCEGWMRTSHPETKSDAGPLVSIYFTITRACNLSCPYCYQGLEDRRRRVMTRADAIHILAQVRAVNPACRVCVTGGEPLLHPQFFDILQAVESHGFFFSLLSNGTLIDERCAERLSEFRNLQNVQVSIDGIRPETHAITRGDSFEATMRGIEHLAKAGVPYSLAPTLHQRNLHEAVDLARLAYGNGGNFTPNFLRVFPWNPRHELRATGPEVSDAIERVGELAAREFQDVVTEGMNEGSGHYRAKLERERLRYHCGAGKHLLDIDWDGTVYPCNLLKEERFVMGNVIEEDLRTILAGAHGAAFNVRSTAIDRCRECILVSVCGGGCRAAAYYASGAFDREDDLCNVLFDWTVRRLLRQDAGDTSPLPDRLVSLGEIRRSHHTSDTTESPRRH